MVVVDGLRFEEYCVEEVVVGSGLSPTAQCCNADWPEVRDDQRDMAVEGETAQTGTVRNKTVAARINTLGHGTRGSVCNDCLLRFILRRGERALEVTCRFGNRRCASRRSLAT